MPRNLCTAGLRGVVTAGALWLSAAAGAAQEILPLAEVAPGQRGYGLSVFRGGEPERFEVEVLGVWQNVLPDTSYILARLSGQGLETSGVVAGMSGSPVYLEDRLAGAVAFAWPFAQEAVAGITPIEAMRELYRPASSPRPPRARPVAGLRQIAGGELPPELLAEGLGRLRSQLAHSLGSGLLWNTVGFAENSRLRLAGQLGSVAAAGASTDGVGELAPGGSVSAVLIDGDLRLAATGTVTDRVGDDLLAFGHSFLGVGEIRVPMATSEVVTVLASRFSSFKIANLGPVVGAFELDRATGIRGRLGGRAPTVPMSVTVAGDRRAAFELRLADMPELTPVLAAVSTLGALDAATQSGGSQGLDLEARLDLGGHGELVIRQSFDGESAGLEGAVYLLAVTAFVLGNELAEVDLEGIAVELRQHPEPRTARLAEAHAGRALVRPGESLTLNLDLLAYRGERFREQIEVTLPTDLPDGRYSLLVGDGVSVDGARLALERSAPLSFRQALELLNGLHARDELVVLGVFGGRGLAVAGETLPQLPGSLRSIWSAAGSSSAQPLRLAVAQQLERRLAVPVEGLLRVDLEVRRREPVAPTPGGELPPSDGGRGDEAAPGEAGSPAAAGDGGEPAAGEGR